MAVMIGNRDEVVRTKAGHAIRFTAGEETHVPDDQYIIKVCSESGHTLKKETKAAAGKTKFLPVE
jgi:hypothetical protein